MEIKPQRYRLSMVLDTFFFPLTSPELLDSLSGRNFNVAPLPPPPLPTGQRTYIGGRVATKNQCFVDVQSDRRIVASEGISIENVVKVFSELTEMVREDFFIDLEKEIDYTEFIADFVVISDKSPIKSVANTLKESKIMKKIGETLGVEISPFVIHIAPKGSSPTDKKWFDIRIMPRITMPKRAYYVNVVFRDVNIEEVLKFVNEVNIKISGLIEIIEGSS